MTGNELTAILVIQPFLAWLAFDFSRRAQLNFWWPLGISLIPIAGAVAAGLFIIRALQHGLSGDDIDPPSGHI